MRQPKVVFTVFSVLFQPLYFLMLLMYCAELQQEEDTLALALDVGILVLGVVFMAMQAAMTRLVWKPERAGTLRTLFLSGLVVWFFLEVVLSYLWCFVTGADALRAHTPFVVLFLSFNAAQLWALRKLGVVGATPVE